MENIQQLIAHINELSSGNQFVTAAISAWLLTMSTYILTKLPIKLLRFVYAQFTTTLELDNSGANFHLSNGFLKWANNQITKNTSRGIFAQSTCWSGTTVILGPSYGNHFFFFDKRLFWMELKMLETTGAEIRKTIKIGTFGRSHKPLHNLVEEFKPKDRSLDVIHLHKWDNKGWENRTELFKRPLSSVILNATIKESITSAIDNFYADKQWYIENGIPYKLGILLHGMPGCGKTSLIKALASHYNKSVFTININIMTDKSLEDAISKVHKDSFILIEDFDSSNAVSKRERVQAAVNKANNVLSEEKESTHHTSDYDMLSLSGVLNAIDGIGSLHENIIFMTTNDIEKIDPAILRKGRCDMTIELPYLTDVEIKEYITTKFDNIDLSCYNFKNIAGCDIQSYLIEHKHDFDMLINALKSDGYVQSFDFHKLETFEIETA
jgi:chaperone BCS1